MFTAQVYSAGPRAMVRRTRAGPAPDPRRTRAGPRRTRPAAGLGFRMSEVRPTL